MIKGPQKCSTIITVPENLLQSCDAASGLRIEDAAGEGRVRSGRVFAEVRVCRFARPRGVARRALGLDQTPGGLSRQPPERLFAQVALEPARSLAVVAPLVV